MKKSIIPIISCLIALYTQNIFCQQITQAETKTLDNIGEDQQKFGSVIKNIEYLENSPINLESDARKAAHENFLQWLSDNPQIDLYIEPYVLELTKENPGLVQIFMCGWAKYYIENPENTDKIKFNAAGVKSIIDFYERGLGVNEDKKIEKLIKLDEKNKLEEWITEKLDQKKDKKFLIF